MNDIYANIRTHVSEVLVRWERLVHRQPWFSLPPDHRIDHLPEVITAVAEAALCIPSDEAAQRRLTEAAAQHGSSHRSQAVPEHLLTTEYHLLRQALWYYPVDTYGDRERVIEAIVRIDLAISIATNASMWGYHLRRSRRWASATKG